MTLTIIPDVPSALLLIDSTQAAGGKSAPSQMSQTIDGL